MSDPRTDPKADDGERARYYEEGASWVDEALGSLRRGRASAWMLAAAAVLVALLNGWALLSLQPLRRTLIYPISVETERGEPLSVERLQPGALEHDLAYNQSMIATYVTAREEFAASRIRKDYTLVELFSAPSIRRDYSLSFQPTSGTGPLRAYPPAAIVEVSITSVSLLDDSHALVRYTKTRADLTGAQPERAQAELAFTYVHGPMRRLDRYSDPLGFQVTAYSQAPD